jgi:hypothetical protein
VANLDPKERWGQVCISIFLSGISSRSHLSSGIVVTSGSGSRQSLIRFHKEKASRRTRVGPLHYNDLLFAPPPSPMFSS